MLRTVIAQLRAQPGRLLASGLAVVLGTAFVTAAIVLGASLRATTADALAAEFAASDAVVEGELDEAALTTLRGLDGVTAVEGRRTVPVTIDGRYVGAVAAAQDRRLQWQPVAAGRLPSAPGELALDTGTAAVLGLDVGDTARLDPTGSAEPGAALVPTRVVGLLDLSASPVHAGTSYALVPATDAAQWADPPVYEGASILGDGSRTDTEVVAAVRAAVPPEALVATGEEQAARLAAALSGDVDVLGRLLLGFAAIALLVSALVIGNTFSILVAQRTRVLALLRCLGATGGQVRGAVLAEALVLGAAASVVGVALGTGVVAAAATAFGGAFPVAPTLTVPGSAVWLPLLAGTVVTVGAAYVPAARATRIAPMAALRPSWGPPVASRPGVLRLLASLALVGAGGLLLAGGVWLASVPVGLLGGTVSFVGVLLGASLLVPRIVAGLGAVASRLGGVPARLAAANAVDNPVRTTATTTALLIGTTLVALMAVGAATARTSLSAELSAELPVDVTVTAVDAEVPADLRSRLDALADVSGSAEIRTSVLEAAGGIELLVSGVDVAEAAAVVRSPTLLEGLADDVLLVNRVTAEGAGWADGGTLPLPSGPLRVVMVEDSDRIALVTAATLARLDPGADVTSLWLQLEPGADPQDAVVAVEGAAGDSVAVGGSAEERASFERVIDTLLRVVTGLLAVAVVIAVIGLANTLSLSELERRRESSLLRALGLTRGQLRATLALEAVLVAVVGALLGLGLGVAYGLAGAATVLGGAVQVVQPDLPWTQLLGVLVLAVLAGLTASYLPGRRAAGVSPVMSAGE